MPLNDLLADRPLLSEEPFPSSEKGTEGPFPSASPVAVPSHTPDGVALRRFGDVPAMREALYQNVLRAASSLPPVENARYRLELRDVNYVDPPSRSILERKRAILEGRSLDRRLRGTWVLVDKHTGKEVDRRTLTVARVPHLTDAGTFVYRGTEYTVANQLRLLPGIYHRIKENGQLEAHVNALPGRGVSQRYEFDPDKGVFSVRVGQASMPLLPLVRALGATDQQLRETWGSEIFAANLPTDSPAALKRIVSRLVRRADASRVAQGADARTLLAEAIHNTRLDPAVTQATLGRPYDRLGLEPILASTRKLLAMSRGQADPDDRDHLAFQQFLGPEDLFAERLEKDYGGLRRALLVKLTASGGSLKYLPTNLLGKQLESLFLSSGLAQSLEEINTGEIFDKLTRITRMGEGGLAGVESIPDEARSVQPSHFGFIDPIRTPESFRAGIDVHAARGAYKGSDGRLYAEFIDARTGKRGLYCPADLLGKTVAFPGEMERGGKRVAALENGRLRYVRRDKVDYILPHFEYAFSPLSNLVPMKSSVKGQRLSMGSRMLTQALPLEDPEAPLVQAALPDDPERSFDEEYGSHFGAVRAETPGVVVRAEPGRIVTRDAAGQERTYELADMVPHARKTFFHQTPTVRPGQVVRPGDVIARSNYTDDRGRVAVGLNARVAYVPWKGLNYEDAFVVSESFAKRAMSQHAYQSALDFDESHRVGKAQYVALFPNRYDRRQLETIDERGLVRPGTTVQFGDPLIVAAKERQPTRDKVHRKTQPFFSDASLRWEHSSPGVVVDSHVDNKGAVVVVKSTAPLIKGDKLSGRYGDKGVAAEVLPDDQMPLLPDGQPADIAINPLGVISRVNPAQILEAVLGKIAAKTGKPYKIRDFEDIEDLTEFTLQEAKRHGVPTLEYVIDPETGKKISNVLVGNRYFLKLHHTVESKAQGRGTGAYTATGEPAKGSSTGAKRLALLETNALLSHGALGVLRDAHLVRGQRNDDFWLAFMQGYNPPTPEVPLVWSKFVDELKASGINVIGEGGRFQVLALTDDDVRRLAGDRTLRNADTLDPGKNMRPIAGGLFDPAIFGHNGERWGKLPLAEPLPNPAFEEPIRRVLGLTEKELEEVLAGKMSLRGKTGPGGVRDLLASIDLDREIESAKQAVASGRKTKRDEALRRLRYLEAAKRTGVHPRQWMLSAVPVLPPRFRPISRMAGSDVPMVSDANYLYKQLWEANDNLRELAGKTADLSEERLATYRALKELVGLADPAHPKLREKNVRGLLKAIFGDSPKHSTVQYRLLSTATDLVGRATIVPDPDLDMDHIGIPENKAWEVYRPFVVRRLRRQGLPLVEAMRHTRDRTPLARRELLAEMESRPVIVNRAPVLHKFGVMAFFARPVKGDAIHLSPLVTKGFAADFDGDAMQYHVPVSDEAVRNAVDLMLPSRNLLSSADFKTPVYAPTQEFLGGLYLATRTPKPGALARPVRRFANRQAVVAALVRGDLDPQDVVEVAE